MSRVAYSGNIRTFLEDWENNRFLDKMCVGARMARIGVSPSERHSWESNASKVSNLIRLAKLPGDVQIAFEYKSPLAGRVDCMLFGRGDDGNKHIVHIELKQWSNDSVSQLYDTGVFQVSAFVGGAYQVLPHPSQQAFNYQSNILNFVPVASQPGTELDGRAYCYNYAYGRIPNDLFSKQYRPVMERCPLHGGDQVSELAKNLRSLLSKGKGEDIFREFVSCPNRPTKNLMDAAANMFRGREEFVLVDDQITSSNAIFGMIAKALEHSEKKLALFVRGGPGTGKTVIALHVIAELAAKHPEITAFFTTRSKALRNTLRSKLESVSTGGTSAAGLIRNIYDFRPANYVESEIDVLLVDEAHRIRRSSNYMADKRGVQTFLPQILSLLYCAKVCVFFIDDKQGVTNDEIGLSASLQSAAENYAELMKREIAVFRAKIEMAKAKMRECRTKLDADILVPPTAKSYGRIARLQTRIEKLKGDINKACQLDAIKSAVSETEVLSIELKSQFRCNGSDNYLDWLDKVVYEKEEDVLSSGISFGDEYLFGICKTPAELEGKIRSLNAPSGKPNQVARLVAGYCWTWSTHLQSNGDLIHDVKIGNWEMPWETNNIQAQGAFASRYAPSADLWASHPKGINQIGCIFSAQGFEVDYVGVILGPDIRFDKQARRIVAVKGKTHGIPQGDSDFDTHIKNIYRVLMSRGRLGCFVYCCDPDLSGYLQSLLVSPASEKDDDESAPLLQIVSSVKPEYRFKRYLPYYGMKAACGYFGDGEPVECEGWVKVNGIASLNRTMFVVRSIGKSMEPTIPDGSLCVFRANPAGSRNGKIVLVQHAGVEDPDTGGAYSIKRYESRKTISPDGGWIHESISLVPVNQDFSPIVITPDNAESFRVVGEFLGIVKSASRDDALEEGI